MKKSLITLALSTLFTSAAFATTDSWVTIKYPISKMHEEGYCMIDSLAHDGISNIGTKELLAAKALTGPFKIAGIQAGEDAEGLTQVNSLFESGLKIGIEVDYDKFDKAVVTIDASEASAKAASKSDKEAVIKNVKIAIYASLANTLSSQIKLAKVELKGLPNQAGLASPVPATFKSAFTAASPYLATIKKELQFVDGKKGCI